MNNEIIKKVLMSYVLPRDYEIHDWDVIIKRREKYKENIFIYHLAYADIYLYDDLEFYDADPKIPILKNLTMNYLNDEDKIRIYELQKYISPKDYELVDWGVILSRKEKVKDNLYKYHVLNMDLYFDDEMFIKEYGNVHIINGKVYYDHLNGNSDGDGLYKLLGDVNYAI